MASYDLKLHHRTVAPPCAVLCLKLSQHHCTLMCLQNQTQSMVQRFVWINDALLYVQNARDLFIE